MSEDGSSTVREEGEAVEAQAQVDPEAPSEGSPESEDRGEGETETPPEAVLPTLMATHHDLVVVCGRCDGVMEFQGAKEPEKRLYVCEPCGLGARADAVQQFGAMSGAFVGARISVDF